MTATTSNANQTAHPVVNEAADSSHIHPDSNLCELGAGGEPCDMCRWANEQEKRRLDERGINALMENMVATTADNLFPPPDFETAWATAPPEYRRYTEEFHALYWYLRGVEDEQRIARAVRRSLAREEAADHHA